MEDDLEARCRRFRQLSSRLEAAGDHELIRMLTPDQARHGWGSTQTIELDGQRVFVKRLPVTSLEMASMFSTKNHYKLPPYYHYGVGSVGFGAFRELQAHLMTSHWVLKGKSPYFPLTYHHRILPRPEPAAGPPEEVGSAEEDTRGREQHRAYVESWNNNPAVSRYLLERTAADHEVVIFSEWFPQSLSEWLPKHPHATARVIDQLLEAVGFLADNDVLHFDAHFNNVVTDGDRPYLTDFGLTIARCFDLDNQEIEFFDAHRNYDVGKVIASLGSIVQDIYVRLDDAARQDFHRRIGLAPDADYLTVVGAMFERVEAVADDAALALHPTYRDALIKHRDIIAHMEAFRLGLAFDNNKRSTYSDSRLGDLLDAAGIAKFRAGAMPNRPVAPGR